VPRVVAHQALKRTAERPTVPYRARDCSVEPVTVAEASALILAFEYLGTMNKALACYGLRAPDGELLGAVSFGRGAGTSARDICGREHRERTIVLERGACVPWAPRNAASYLIRRAVTLAHQEHGWAVFVAYGDPDAGEYGTIYSALGWSYLGQGLGSTRPGYREEYLRVGDARWRDERVLRSDGRRLTKAEALGMGWRHRYRPNKFVFAWIEGEGYRYRYTPRPFPVRPILGRTAFRAHYNRQRICAVCAVPLAAQRSTRRTCSVRCRVAHHRKSLSKLALTG
jgi:hypothetical protein